MTGPINIGPTSMGDFLRSRIDPKLSRFGVRRLIAPGSYQARRENEKSKVGHEGVNGRWAAVGGLLPEQFWATTRKNQATSRLVPPAWIKKCFISAKR